MTKIFALTSGFVFFSKPMLTLLAVSGIQVSSRGLSAKPQKITAMSFAPLAGKTQRPRPAMTL